ncbi:MAG TPA: YesL family protein [Symbiobacteriaceae bacterium]|nr:YesL family protein [Symbiobacteriaceae bacterium]
MNPWEDRFPRLWAFGEKVSVLVIGGLLFFLFAAPVITIPAALVGLVSAAGALIRPVPGETVGRFWRGFKRSFGRALLLGLIDLVVGGVLWFDFQFFMAMGSPLTRVAAYLFASLGFVAAMANVYAWPLLAWFPQPLGPLLKRSLMLAAAHPLQAMLGLACVLAVGLLYMVLPGPVKSLAVLLGPGLIALSLGAAAWLAMKRYARPDEEFAE